MATFFSIVKVLAYNTEKMRKKGFDFEMNDESMMHKPLITKLGYAGFHALNWS